MSSSEKCFNCRRKTYLVTKCKCEKKVCLECRHPEDHHCSYDYQQEQREKIQKENPEVHGEKLQKV